MKYKVPDSTRIGHTHLKVSNIKKALEFYQDILGFEIMQWYGDSAVFLSAGGYHHHLGLNTWYSKGAAPSPRNSCGLFHVAILYATRKELSIALQHIMNANYPITGASDHGVSEAVYMDDPDGNGIEIYWDRPKSKWPLDSNGNLKMMTEPLDLEDLLQEADR